MRLPFRKPRWQWKACGNQTPVPLLHVKTCQDRLHQMPSDRKTSNTVGSSFERSVSIPTLTRSLTKHLLRQDRQVSIIEVSNMSSIVSNLHWWIHHIKGTWSASVRSLFGWRSCHHVAEHVAGWLGLHMSCITPKKTHPGDVLQTFTASGSKYSKASSSFQSSVLYWHCKRAS